MDAVFRLPGGFRVDGRLIDEVEFRELSGFEEDIMADTRLAEDGTGEPLINSSQRITEVLSRCTVRIGEKVHDQNRDCTKADPKVFRGLWSQALAGDRGAAVVQLRRLSLGDAYVFSEMCANRECKAEIRRIRYDLGKAELGYYYRNYLQKAIKRDEYDTEEEWADAIEMRRTAMLMEAKPSIRLPSGSTATYTLFNAEHEEELSKMRDKHKDRVISALIGYHLISVDDRPVDAPHFNIVKALPARDRQFLLSFFSDIEGGIDTNVEITCNKCGHSFTKKLDVTKPGFFYLSAAE